MSELAHVCTKNCTLALCFALCIVVVMDRRAYRAAWYRARYAGDAGFRMAEYKRRLEWIEDGGREKVRAQVAAWRKRQVKLRIARQK
jgi:hypothetical protein